MSGPPGIWSYLGNQINISLKTIDWITIRVGKVKAAFVPRETPVFFDIEERCADSSVKGDLVAINVMLPLMVARVTNKFSRTNVTGRFAFTKFNYPLRKRDGAKEPRDGTIADTPNLMNTKRDGRKLTILRKLGIFGCRVTG
jgi:hypothetical protein